MKEGKEGSRVSRKYNSVGTKTLVHDTLTDLDLNFVCGEFTGIH